MAYCPRCKGTAGLKQTVCPSCGFDLPPEVSSPRRHPGWSNLVTGVILAGVGVIAFSTIGAGLIAAMAFVGLTFLEGHFVTPTIIGRRLELNALAVFMALAFWTWLWGPMGGFLSSPLLIVGLILKEHLLPVASPQLPPG